MEVLCRSVKLLPRYGDLLDFSGWRPSPIEIEKIIEAACRHCKFVVIFSRLLLVLQK